LRGSAIVPEFLVLLEQYVARRYLAREPVAVA
jgi:hypothetical protein